MFKISKYCCILFILAFTTTGLKFLSNCQSHLYANLLSEKTAIDKQSALSSPKIRICLNMIVKNKAHIIERCLNSVKDIIDCISICDTGSNDNTVEIIEQFMKKYHIPGKVHRHTWVNFGYNRTLSFHSAQEILHELQISLSDAYLLLMDADMILEIDSSFIKESLTADSYYVRQKNQFETYQNIRLIRASLPWKCVGMTHEHWVCKKSKINTYLQTLQINDCEDGGCKADKYERDINLLKEEIKKEPNNSRCMFYLAQTYRALGNIKEAVRWYEARIAVDTGKMEVWYSKLAIGKIYEELGLWTQALRYYLDAYACYPHQAEPLYRIALHYRCNEQYHLAYLFAKQGLQIPRPQDQFLYICHPVYDYQLDEEMSIVAYYTPFREDGFAAANRLVLKKDIPLQTKNLAFYNLLFYVQPLKCAQFKLVESYLNDKSVENNKITFHVLPCYDFSHFSPSAAPIEFEDGNLLLVCETISVDQQRYNLHRFLFLDKNLNVKKLSKPFVFKHKGKEWCTEMTIDHPNNQCVISIHIENKEFWVCSVSLDIIRSLLESIS